MKSVDNYYADKPIDLMADARIHAIADPLINITLQGGHETYPKAAGHDSVKEREQKTSIRRSGMTASGTLGIASAAMTCLR